MQLTGCYQLVKGFDLNREAAILVHEAALMALRLKDMSGHGVPSHLAWSNLESAHDFSGIAELTANEDWSTIDAKSAR
jgi:serine phosphatase RsbU (regulator of sigma subunit)